jgi:hypothetical protein
MGTGTGTGTPGGSGASTPSFTLGRTTTDKKAGTAAVTVSFSAPATGTLALSGKGLKPVSRRLSGTSSTRLVVAATGAARRALIQKGSRKVRFAVTFKPAGAAPQSAERTATLSLRPPR